MGNYTDKSALIDAIGGAELIARTDRERTGDIDDTVLDSYIAEAEAEIDGYLRAGGYTVPLSTPLDPMIPRLCVDMLRYHLWRGTQTPQDIQDRYKAAVGRLKDVKSGTISLYLAPADAPADSGIGYNAPDRVFTDENLSGF